MELTDLNNFIIFLIKGFTVLSILVSLIRGSSTERSKGYFIKHIVLLILIILVIDRIPYIITNIGSLMQGG